MFAMCCFTSESHFLPGIKQPNIVVYLFKLMKKYFDKVVEWDKNLIKKCQEKWGLSDYQVVCISFAKGFIIGAILL